MRFQKYFLFIVLVILFPSVYSLSASIGNAKMVLRPVVEEGQITTIEKSIQVNNVNSVPVLITAYPSKDFEEIITIPEPEFILEPGESKQMTFIISLEYGGRYEGRIHIGFKPADPVSRESSVGLSSSIIIIAEGPENPNPQPPSKEDQNDVPPLQEPEPELQPENIEDQIIDNVGKENGDSEPIDSEKNQEEKMTITNEKKPQPLIGVIIIIAIVLVGGLTFYLIHKR